MATWTCINHCGACCYLEPGDRPDLEDYLDPASLELYLSLVGPEGWCIHYDRPSRQCSIYNDRPWFCRVRADSFGTMFGIEPDELNDFAIDCCREHIADIYGDRSLELHAFDRAVGVTSSRTG